MHPALAPYADLIVNAGDPKTPRMLERPRRARVRAHTYGGDVVDLELDVVATAQGVVCVRQPRTDADPWHAWVPADAARTV